MKVKCLLVGVVVLFIAGVFVNQSYAKIELETILGMWFFDEGSGKTTKDWSSRENDGTLVGAKWVEGVYGQALEFNTGDYVDIGDNPITDIKETNILTICAWVKRTSKTSQILVAIRRTPGGYILGVGVTGASANQIKMTKFAVVDIYLGDFPQDTEWHHLVGVWDARGQTVYIDGEVNANSGDTANFSSASGKLLIGGDTSDQGYTEGAIDDVAIFNVALTSADVSDIYSQGLGKVTGLASVSPKGRLTTAWGEIKAF